MIVFLFVLALNSYAFALTEGAEASLVEHLDHFAANGTARHVTRKFPGLIVASASGWDYLPARPSEALLKFAGFWAQDHFAPLLRDNNKLVCGDYAVPVPRVSGEMSVLRLESEGSYTLSVYPFGSGTLGAPLAVHRLGFINAQQLSLGRGLQCTSFFPFTMTCAYYAPEQFLQMEYCGRGEACQSVQVSYADHNLNNIVEGLRRATFIFGNGYDAFARMHQAKRDLDDHLTAEDVYVAQFKDFFDEVRVKYRSGMMRLQERMMLLAELKRACGFPAFRQSVLHKGVLQIVDAPPRTDADAPAGR